MASAGRARPSSRITDRTSSGPAGTPQATRSVCTRRYPYVPSDSSNDLFTIRASSPRLFAVADSGAFRHSSNPDRDTSIHLHIFTIDGTCSSSGSW